jgi:streptogramin lyase
VHRKARPARVVEGAVTEFDLPVAQDLPHDLAVDARGRVIITGMFTHQMYVLNPASKEIDTVAIPIDKANPRALEIDSTGAWWVALGGPKRLARYTPETGAWDSFVAGHYPHSLALGRPGEVWWNGHFTRAPELIGRVVPATGARDSFVVPPHPKLAGVPGGPIPYEIRIGPDGRVWGSELQGNRIFACDPARGTFRVWDMPLTHSGPRRLDIDRDGIVWIPAYAANELVRFDPRTSKFQRIVLPVPDAVPYVVRVDASNGRVWIGTSAADLVLCYEPKASRFTLYPLPSRGAMVRHLASRRAQR